MMVRCSDVVCSVGGERVDIVVKAGEMVVWRGGQFNGGRLCGAAGEGGRCGCVEVECSGSVGEEDGLVVEGVTCCQGGGLVWRTGLVIEGVRCNAGGC